MVWLQRVIRLAARSRGCHLVTQEIVDAMPEVAGLRVGLLHVFIQHTSASLTINENADPDVRVDMETALSAIVPESLPFVHTLEGPDDMPAHVKSTLCGASLSIPVGDGRLCLGTWQGIYLAEHRDRATSRSLVVTLQGESQS